MTVIPNRSVFRCALSVVLGVGFALTLAFAQDGPIRVGGNVQQANLISQVHPVYPAEAKEARIQGIVKLDVVIDKEGHVSQVSVVSGPTSLVQSAVEAVQQWVYKPTLLNGQPVFVQTTVDVNYTLSQ
jgi:protein TonB